MAETSTQLSDIERTIADIIDHYADFRTQYIHGDLTDYHSLNDTDRALTNEVNGLRIAAELVRSHRDSSSSMGLPSRLWQQWSEFEREQSVRLDSYIADVYTDDNTTPHQR